MLPTLSVSTPWYDRVDGTVACAACVVTGLGTVYTVGLLLGMPDPDWAYLARGVLHLGELATLLALGLSGATGTGPLGSVNDLVGGTVEHLVVVRLHADADAFVRETGHG